MRAGIEREALNDWGRDDRGGEQGARRRQAHEPGRGLSPRRGSPNRTFRAIREMSNAATSGTTVIRMALTHKAPTVSAAATSSSSDGLVVPARPRPMPNPAASPMSTRAASGIFLTLVTRTALSASRQRAAFGERLHVQQERR